MSGLVAIYDRDGRPVEPDTVWAALVAASYRGPDGLRVRTYGDVGFGHAKMVVTPEEEQEQQPLVSSRTGCVIIADARLDNRETLLALLADTAASSISDGEIILRAYERWGADSAVRLLGDFAFVIWDPRAQRLVCGRDTSGQRSLFYRVDHRAFAAASEIHQLLQDPAVPVAPNEARIRDCLVPLNAYRNQKDGHDTFYDGIFAVPAGHLVTVDREAVHVRRYWHFEPPAEIRYRRDEEYAEHFRSLFFDIVNARLRSSRPVGALLSGGLDSSSVVCTAQELYRTGRATDRGFVSFSSVFHGLDCDERDFIATIQEKYGIDARYVPSHDSSGLLQVTPQGFWPRPHLGSTGGGDAVLLAASQAGVRVLLSGDVADACVAGLRFVFDSLLRQGRLAEFWRHFRAFRRITSEPLSTTLALSCVAPLLPMLLQKRIMLQNAQRTFGRYRHRIVPMWVSAPLREDIVERQLALYDAEERGRRFASPAREAEYRLLYPPAQAGLPPGWPLQSVAPFADRRLHAFLLAIPPEQKYAPHPETDEFYAGSKRILRRAMTGIVPDAIRTRKSKTEFSSSVRSSVDQQWNDYQTVFGPAARPHIAARGYVDQRLFWSRLEHVRTGEVPGDFIYVMRMVELENWLRGFTQPRPQRVTVLTPWHNQPQAAQIPGQREAQGVTA